MVRTATLALLGLGAALNVGADEAPTFGSVCTREVEHEVEETSTS